MHTDTLGGAPVGCRCVRQVALPLRWLRVILDKSTGNLVRRFPLRNNIMRGRSVVITTDASSWGIGGVLELDGTVAEYFHDRPYGGDRAALQLADQPDPADQQVLEGFAFLLALRTWRSH